MQNILLKNKYRIQSARRNAYNYSQNGFYFVTICTQNRQLFFGNIINAKMQLLEIGEVAEKEWVNTGKIRKNVILHEFVIMPNHVHAIIQIKNQPTVETHCNASNSSAHPGNTDSEMDCNASDSDAGIETHFNASLRGGACYKNKFGPQSNNLSSMIRGFKGVVKKYATINDIDFAWQSRFHDHIIRNEQELNRIRFYIKINVEKWDIDRNNLNVSFAKRVV